MKHPTLLMLLITISLLLHLPGSAGGNDGSEDDWSFAYYHAAGESPGYLLVVEKAHQRLTLFALGDRLSAVLSLPCATGENQGMKYISGDRRTPQGIYFITEIYEDRKITIFGSRAFHLDYPNIFDRHAGRGGDGIFIHGTNKTLAPYSTNGCITLDNLDLDQLAPYLKIRSIPVLVVDAIAPTFAGIQPAMAASSPQLQDILEALGFRAGELPVENIHTLSLLRLGEQAVASIGYTEFDGLSLQYRHHKRSYLTAGITKTWRTVHSQQNQETMPSILAQQSVKDRLLAKMSISPSSYLGEGHREWERGPANETLMQLE